MKILFVENMYRTYFWEAISKRLEQDGFQTAWIVQNHFFAPNANEVVKIPYPKRNELKNYDVEDKDFSFIRSTDRIINYFDGTDEHYPYYYQKFIEALDSIKPNLVIGESTLFHELMIIDICKDRNIPYLHPSSSSYPPKRFSFYQNDSKIPLGGEQHIFNVKEYDEYIDAISKRKIVPDYMKKPVLTTNKYNYPKHKSIRDKCMRLKAYFSGEKYNTPSPLKKIKKDKELQLLLGEWDALATPLSSIDKSKKIILYPLQLQPEANLDVWGHPHRDQVKLIKKLSDSIPEDWVVVVKTNPKSKYEMSSQLLTLMRDRENVIALDRDVPMTDIFNKSEIVVTVTGTIAIECVLAGKPLALLGVSIVDESAGCVNMNSIHEIKNLIDIVEKDMFITANQEDKRKIIHRMMTTSYPGLISDPVSNPNCVDENNLELVAKSFLTVIERIEIYEK